MSGKKPIGGTEVKKPKWNIVRIVKEKFGTIEAMLEALKKNKELKK